MTKNDDTRAVESYLSRPEIHDQWEDAYRTPANDAFHELVFDTIVTRVGASARSRWLDAGSGPCFHSARLARRDLDVVAVDFSPVTLAAARENLRGWGIEDRVHVGRADLLGLPFPDGAFPYVLCWGVLMHVPEVATAIEELARVTASGGWIVVSEANMHSAQAVAERAVGRARRRPPPVRTPMGLETWTHTDAGTLLARRADIGWLVARFAEHGCALTHRVANQFTEAYTVAPRRLRGGVHAANRFWFRHVGAPGPAFGNLLYFRRS